MWLLHTTTLTLHEFIGEEVPRYAILSHTWGDEEISFKEMKKIAKKTAKKTSSGFEPVEFPPGSGYNKIVDSCQTAVRDGFSWIWIDTCCIDKRSSAELSESINSMYKWYERAAICYVFMADVEHKQSEDVVSEDKISRNEEIHDDAIGDEDSVDKNLGYKDPIYPSIKDSRWFKRGWTLQELIAPSNVALYDKNWACLGTKSKLIDVLAIITRIPKSLLAGEKPLKQYSIAQRMSWASRRETTRKEDLAYCLMGLFDIHMPLLYGEGDKAFLRLQKEIIKSFPDQSIFAWQSNDGIGDHIAHGLLAKSPKYFAQSHYIMKGWHPIPPAEHNDKMGDGAFQLTNVGLSITLRTEKDDVNQRGEWPKRAFLKCHQRSRDGSSRVFIYLNEKFAAVGRIRCGAPLYHCDSDIYPSAVPPGQKEALCIR